jgi:hypothetical protein
MQGTDLAQTIAVCAAAAGSIFAIGRNIVDRRRDRRLTQLDRVADSLQHLAETVSTKRGQPDQDPAIGSAQRRLADSIRAVRWTRLDGADLATGAPLQGLLRQAEGALDEVNRARAGIGDAAWYTVLFRR